MPVASVPVGDITTVKEFSPLFAKPGPSLPLRFPPKCHRHLPAEAPLESLCAFASCIPPRNLPAVSRRSLRQLLSSCGNAGCDTTTSVPGVCMGSVALRRLAPTRRDGFTGIPPAYVLLEAQAFQYVILALPRWQSGEMRRFPALACFPIRPGAKPSHSRRARQGCPFNAMPLSYQTSGDTSSMGGAGSSRS
jgi:hypothetical protein